MTVTCGIKAKQNSNTCKTVRKPWHTSLALLLHTGPHISSKVSLTLQNVLPNLRLPCVCPCAPFAWMPFPSAGLSSRVTSSLKQTDYLPCLPQPPAGLTVVSPESSLFSIPLIFTAFTFLFFLGGRNHVFLIFIYPELCIYKELTQSGLLVTAVVWLTDTRRAKLWKYYWERQVDKSNR